MTGVAQEWAGGVGPGGWPSPRYPVDHLELPGAVGDVDVVAGAGEDQVVDVGAAGVGPGGDVVDLAQVAGDGAAGDDAADVAGVQGGLLGGGGEAVAAAQVQHGAVLVQDDPADAGVAGQQRQRGGVHRPALLGVREPVQGGVPGWLTGGQGTGVRELIQAGGDDDVDAGVGTGADTGRTPYLVITLAWRLVELGKVTQRGCGLGKVARWGLGKVARWGS